MTELNEHSDSLIPRSQPPEAGRALTLVNLARDAEQRGDVGRSLRYYDDALALLGDETDLSLLADTLRWKGTVHREQGETELAQLADALDAPRRLFVPCQGRQENRREDADDRDNDEQLDQRKPARPVDRF